MRAFFTYTVLILWLVLDCSHTAHAWPGWKLRHDHRPKVGSVAKQLPWGAYEVQSGGQGYFYGHGVFYTRLGNQYEVVRPPIGAVVKSIPDYYRPKSSNGATYYTSDGVYFVHTPDGYRVVPTPI